MIMRNKKEKIFTGIIVIAFIASFSIGSLSMRGISTAVDDSSFSVSNLSTQDMFWPGNSSEWTEVAPEEQGLNSSKIEEMFDFINSSKMNIHSIIIVRNGYLLLEEYLYKSQIYRNATGDKEYHFGGFIHDQASTTKSLMSILMGIALQEGFLDNLSQTLYEFFADIWDPSFTNCNKKKKITIEHLLTMTSGLSGSYYYPNAETRIAEDCIDWALDRVPLIFNPGEEGRWEYSNDGPNLLSGIITNVTGKSAEEFAREYLFERLQISEDEYYWWNDSKGIDYGGYAFQCSPKVQAKLGILALNNGIWDGTQILSPNYMKDATTAIIGDLLGYGYLWWITKSPFEGFYAMGAGGQCIYIIPEYNIVVGFTASGGPSYQQMIADYILQFVEIPGDPMIPGFNLNLIYLTIFCAAVVILIRSKKSSKN
jgi:hypothetical protein